MIFVTVGTQDKPFTRLLDALETAIQNGEIQDRVIVQCGDTSFTSRVMEIHSFMDMDTFSSYMEVADMVITHAGVGTILQGLGLHKKMLVAARRAEYKEHTNDHQVELLEAFEEKGYIKGLHDFSTIGDACKETLQMEVKDYPWNKENFTQKLKAYMDK